MAEIIQGRLGYNSRNNRYGLLVSDLWVHDGFHCGECLEVLVELSILGQSLNSLTYSCYAARGVPSSYSLL